MLENMIYVAMLDQHRLVRKAIKTLIQTNSNLNVTIDAGSAHDLFDQLEKETRVDVLLLDIHPLDATVNDVMDKIRQNYAHIRIIILTNLIDLKVISDLMDQGVLAYIPKRADPSQLVEAIESAMQNRIYKNSILTKALYWKTNSQMNHPKKEPGKITDTDKRVMSLLWEEKSTRDIAKEMLLSPSTIEKIKQNLKEKLDIKTTIGLIKYAVEKKIILINHTIEL